MDIDPVYLNTFVLQALLLGNPIVVPGPTQPPAGV